MQIVNLNVNKANRMGSLEDQLRWFWNLHWKPKEQLQRKSRRSCQLQLCSRNWFYYAGTRQRWLHSRIISWLLLLLFLYKIRPLFSQSFGKPITLKRAKYVFGAFSTQLVISFNPFMFINEGNATCVVVVVVIPARRSPTPTWSYRLVDFPF